MSKRQSKRGGDSEGRPSTAEMMECLRRSGYMLESTVVRNLTAAGFFVEPNQSVQDARTGKSRELDIVAESNRLRRGHRGVAVTTTFVMEVMNNLYPFVLMTPRPPSPNVPIDDYFRYASTPREENSHPFLGHVDMWEVRGCDKWSVHSQYCAFTRKRGDAELMACHPDDAHSGIQKMAEYSVDAVETWSLGEAEGWWRLFFWQPILVLRDDLFVLTDTCDAEAALEPVDSAKLEYNFHYGSRPETILVDVVTEACLLDLLREYVRQDEICEEQLFKLKQRR